MRLRCSCKIGMAVLLSVAACANAADNAPPANDPAFHKQLLDIAANYSKYGRVDDVGRFAPWMCRMPPPSLARISESKDTQTHGQKIYFLFAKDRNAYLTPDKEPVQGQVIVKESWVPKEVAADTPKTPVVREAAISDAEKTPTYQKGLETFLPFARKDGKLYHSDSKSGLFIMLKMDPKTPNTDDGWVYGTVSADAKTVTSSGRVQSCMGCHQDAPRGRLFGLKKVDEPGEKTR
jgi:hypothetical protein